MNINNVYIGQYKKNSRETVFCKRSADQYEDLKKEGSEVFVSEIDLDSLIPYEEVFATGKKVQMKNSIVKLYNQDRSQKIALNRVFIGDIYKVTEIIDQKFTNPRNKSFYGSDCHTILQGSLVKKGALLLNFEKLLQDMERPIKIRHNNYPKVGELIVIENDLITLASQTQSVTERLQPFTKLVPMTEEKAAKRKILQNYREYRGKL